MIYETDPWLEPYRQAIDARHRNILETKKKLASDAPLVQAVNNHIYYPLHREGDDWVIREWAPGATRIYLVGDFNNWKRTEAYCFKPAGQGNWELRVPGMFLRHGDLQALDGMVRGSGGASPRLCEKGGAGS